MKFTLPPIALLLAVALPDLASAGFAASCTWTWQNPKYVVATCTKNNGSTLRTRQDMNLCIGVNNSNGRLITQNNGNAFQTCWNTAKQGNTDLKSTCWDWHEDEYMSTVEIYGIMNNLDGYLWCYGHRSAPY